jgi:aminotransferase
MLSRHMSKRVSDIPASGIRKFFDVAAVLEDVISLGIGEPDFDTPEPILQAGIRSLQNGETHYTSNYGRMDLREAVAKYLENQYGVVYDPGTEIIITVGVSEALYLANTTIVDPGDEILIPTPCFVSYQPEVKLAGGVPVIVPCRAEENFDLNIELLEKSISENTKGVLFGFPSNPTGVVARREKLEGVARLATENDLVVISDELYDQLVYGVEHVCFSSLPGMRERTLLLGGFSKNYAMTGWRVGFMCGPADLIAGAVRVHQYAIMCAPTTAQAGALEALRTGSEYAARMRDEYDRRRKLIVSGMNEIGLTTFEPLGAFYAFPDISSTGLDDQVFSERLLLEEKVAVIPGKYFGAGGAGHIRCSYATAYDQIEEALRRIERFVNRL